MFNRYWWFSSIYGGLPFSRLLVVVLFVVAFLLVCASAPASFPVGRVVTIDSGSTLSEVSHVLKDERVVRFANIFEVLVTLIGRDERIQAGDYVFAKRTGVLGIVWRVTSGIYGLDTVRVRLPEGSTRSEIANTLSAHIANFDAGTFLRVTEDKEGFLFPDTYFFLPNTSAERIANILSDTFQNKTETLRTDAASSSVSFRDIVTMASIIEREAHDAEDRRLISSVLWNRIEIGMPLQVDAPFVFLFGKGSRDLTKEDLATSSPYNTYINKGLPPGPISNPGLDAIDAALNPAGTDYFYYLSDGDGVTHFATDFDGHQINRELYLR